MKEITLKTIYEAQIASNKKLAKLSKTQDRVLTVVLQTRDDVADMKPRLRNVEIRSEVAIRSLDRFIGVQKKHESELAANSSAINRHEHDLERIKVKTGLTAPSN